MAIWQYTFKVVPQSDLKELGVITHLLDEDYNNFIFWRNEHYGVKFFKRLTTILESKPSWSKDIKLYGTEESNCIEIFMDDNVISELTVRIDYRTNYSDLLNQLVEFCTMNSLALIDEDNEVLQLNATSIVYVIQNSSQYKKLIELRSP
jgi:hypothetical protein